MRESDGSQDRKGLSGRELPEPEAVGFEAVVPNPKLKLMDQVREVLRLRHYSMRTEQSYCDWIRRYVKFHGMGARGELFPAEAKIELFLSDLAVRGRVAAATQNQAFNALLFLYTQVLHQKLGNSLGMGSGWEVGGMSERESCQPLLRSFDKAGARTCSGQINVSRK